MTSPIRTSTACAVLSAAFIAAGCSVPQQEKTTPEFKTTPHVQCTASPPAAAFKGEFNISTEALTYKDATTGEQKSFKLHFTNTCTIKPATAPKEELIIACPGRYLGKASGDVVLAHKTLVFDSDITGRTVVVNINEKTPSCAVYPSAALKR